MEALSITAVATPAVPLNDCWNRIGVRGDSSCPQLEQYAHCSNCPVHASAALDLLDHRAPPGYLADCTRQLARISEQRVANVASAVIFRVGAEWLALATGLFREVVALPRIRALPHRQRNLVDGIANVRGGLLVCVSLAGVLGLDLDSSRPSERQRTATRRLVVVALDDQRLGFTVDEMHGIHRFDPTTLQAVPSTVARATATYSKATLPWEGRAVGLLDEQLLFYAFNRGLA